MNHSGLIATVEGVFDKAITVCVEMSRAMQVDAAVSMGVKDDRLPASVLTKWASKYYEIVAHTLFEVLKLTQPEDFKGDRSVNFYYWPGYHSVASGRIYAASESKGSEAAWGIGLCGDPANPDTYTDCHQAHWYQVVTAQDESFWPASPYDFVMEQQPLITEQPRVMLASITFSTQSVRGDTHYPGFLVRRLDSRDFRTWGLALADVLNQTVRRYSSWQFPDRRDRRATPRDDEGALSTLRLMLLSRWMHSMMGDGDPEWFDDLLQEARRQRLDTLERRLIAARAEQHRPEWAISNTQRPAFTTWTTLVLDQIVTPELETARSSAERGRRPELVDPNEQFRDIGWATLLCSVPMRLPFKMLARRWLRTVHATMRQAENAALYNARQRSRDQRDYTAVSVHELGHYLDEGKELLGTTGYPPFFAATVRAMVDCLNLVRVPDRVTQGFQSALKDPDALQRILARAVADVCEATPSSPSRRGATLQLVHMPDCEPLTVLSHLEMLRIKGARNMYAASMLLTGELVRNHLRHGEGKATWYVVLRDKTLEVTLEANRTKNNEILAEQLVGTLRQLDVLLQMICKGSVVPALLPGTVRWSVVVRLP
jgi:hypothetical protein